MCGQNKYSSFHCHASHHDFPIFPCTQDVPDIAQRTETENRTVVEVVMEVGEEEVPCLTATATPATPQGVITPVSATAMDRARGVQATAAPPPATALPAAAR